MNTEYKKVHLVYEPTITCIAEMLLDEEGINVMAKWVKEHRPECLSKELTELAPGFTRLEDLLPHDGTEADGPITQRTLSSNELLVELAGRKCYDSFAEKAGKKTNREYIENLVAYPVAHASVFYHAKMSFFIGGVSRRMSHELIRNYVGADRSEEGSPSQESTRFTEHYGYFIVPPRIVVDEHEVEAFEYVVQNAYDDYLGFIRRQTEDFRARNDGALPQGMHRKRIYEAASAYLPHSAETSFIWTTNPIALAKLFKERCAPEADLEFQRFAYDWRELCYKRWPNLFPEKLR